MATYFDITKDADLKLLKSAYQGHPDTPATATTVELEVIDYYRERLTSTSFKVQLIGWEDNADDAPAQLLLDMRMTIARVIDWRMKHRHITPGVTREKQGSYEREGYIDPMWPPGWNNLLVKHDCRTRPNV